MSVSDPPFMRIRAILPPEFLPHFDGVNERVRRETPPDFSTSEAEFLVGFSLSAWVLSASEKRLLTLTSSQAEKVRRIGVACRARLKDYKYDFGIVIAHRIVTSPNLASAK